MVGVMAGGWISGMGVPFIRQDGEKRVEFDSSLKGPRVLFVGNSITFHSANAKLGWTNNCGMAASASEKDYVHLLESRVKAVQPEAQCRIMQSSIEREFPKPVWSCEALYRGAREFAPDIMVLYFGANVKQDYMRGTMQPPPARRFGEALEEFINYIDPERKALVLIPQGFYTRKIAFLEAEKKATAEKLGCKFIPMADVNANPKAMGRLGHPGDEGMRMIADRIWEHMREFATEFPRLPGRVAEVERLKYGAGDFWTAADDGTRALPQGRLIKDGGESFVPEGDTFFFELKGVKEGDWRVRVKVKDEEHPRREAGATFLFKDGTPLRFERSTAPVDGWYVLETGPARLKAGDVIAVAGMDRRKTGWVRTIGGIELAKEGLENAWRDTTDLYAFNDCRVAGLNECAMEAGKVKLKVRNRTGVKRKLRIEAKVLDYWQREVAAYDETVETAGTHTAEIGFGYGECDNYRAWVHVTDEETGRVERKILFCDAPVTKGMRRQLLLDGLKWEHAWTADDGTYETRRMKDEPGEGVKWTGTTLPAGRIKEKLTSGAHVHQQWYRTKFRVPPEHRGERHFIHVGVSHVKTRIFVNGKKAGENELALQCLPFEVEVTGLLDLEGENELLIAGWGLAGNYMDEELKTLPTLTPARCLKGAYYSYHGQLSTVTLQTRPKVHLAEIPRVMTSVKDSAIEVLAEAPKGTEMRHRVLYKGKEVVAPFCGKVKWEKPILWGPAANSGRIEPDRFKLLQLETTIYGKNGEALDRTSTRFGFREFECAGREFRWNGKPLRGVARCHVPEYGRYPWDCRKQDSLDWLERVAWVNTRFVGHAMTQNFFYDWSDELGVLLCRNTSMMCVGDMTTQYRENPAFWENKMKNDLRAIDLYPNHPSVYIWYLSNEFGMAHNHYGATLMQPILKAVERKDPTRFAETGCDLDLWGAAKFHSVHYPVYNAFREPQTFLPDCFYWRPLDKEFEKGGRVPSGQSLRVCNVMGDSKITWGEKPIQVHETGWDHFMDFPHSPSRLWGEDAYNGGPMIQRMHAEYNRTYFEGHRDADCFHISPWRHFDQTLPDYEMPPLEAVAIQRHHAFYEGARVRYDVNLFHDLTESGELEFYWELAGRDGTAARKGGERIAADWCRTHRVEIAFEAPAAGKYELRWGVRGRLERKRAVEVYAAAVNEGLEERGNVIKAGDALGEAEVKRAEAGETIVVLARKEYPDCLPLKLTLNQRNAAVNFTYRPGHPALGGMTADDLSYWGPGHCTGRGYFDKPASGGARTLVEAGGPCGLGYAAVIEAPCGKGTMIFCRLDMDAEARKTNPLAARLLRSLAEYRRGDEGGVLGLYCEDGRIAEKLAEFGVAFERIGKGELGDAGKTAKYAALYVEGAGVGAGDVKAGAGQRVFVKNPGEGWGVALTNGVHKQYPGRAVKTLKGHKLLEGLTNCDFFWRKKVQTITMYDHLSREDGKVADVGTAQIRGARALLFPAFLAERGNVAFETLNWFEDATPEVRDNAERIITTLLANAGVKVTPGKRAAAAKPVFVQARSNPELCRKHMAEAAKHRAAKRPDAALDSLFKAQRADGGMLSVYNDIAEIYEQKGDLKKALEWYRKSLDFDYNQPPIIRRVGELEKGAKAK